MPRHKKLKWLVVALVVVSMLLLVFATYSQAHWHRNAMSHQAFALGEHMQTLAGMRRAGFASPFQENGFTAFFGNINMAAVLFHKDHMDQPPVYTVVLGRGLSGYEHESPEPEYVRSIRRFARLEAEALEHAREVAAVLAVLEREGYASGPDVWPGNLWRYTFRRSDTLPTDDDCQLTWQFTWVAETYPLAAAMRQLIPVYIMTALLLTALILTQRQLTKTRKENLDG